MIVFGAVFLLGDEMLPVLFCGVQGLRVKGLGILICIQFLSMDF